MFNFFINIFNSSRLFLIIQNILDLWKRHNKIFDSYKIKLLPIWIIIS